MKKWQTNSRINIFNILRLLTASILFILASIPIIIHNYFNLKGASAMGSVHYEFIKTIAEIPNAVKNLYYSTQWMNFVEIIFFVIIPSLIICLGIWVIAGNKLLINKPVILLIPFVVVFILAQTTNIVGIRLQIERVLPIWEKAGNLIQNTNINQYRLTLGSDAGIDTQVDSGLDYSTKQTLEELKFYYASKGVLLPIYYQGYPYMGMYDVRSERRVVIDLRHQLYGK